MFRLVPLLVSAHALNDETSLMQGLKPTQQVTQGSDKSKAITNLLSTATSMLKSGATTDVVAFAQATLAELESDILPAINTSHDADQAYITLEHGRFQTALDNLAIANNEIAIRRAAERLASEQHKRCRGEEEDICYRKRQCDYDLWELWKKFEDEEETMRECSDEIENHWCVEGANGTSWVFRDHAITLFPCFHEQWPIVLDWEYQYGVKREICVELYHELDRKTEECDGHQAELERAACAHASKVEEVRVAFANEWFFAVWSYQRAIDHVHCMELDRWKEWKHLTTIQCLLERTHDRNGRPCEEASDEIATEITYCEEQQHLESIEHLVIFYPPVPPFPDPPAPPHAPCSPGFIEQEYAELWTPPQPIFHEPLELLHPAAIMLPYYDHRTGNSHCNQRPPCVDCHIEVEPPICASVYDAAVNHGSMTWVLPPTVDDECHSATRAQMDEGYWFTVFYQWFDHQWIPDQYVEGALGHSLYYPPEPVVEEPIVVGR